MDDEPDGIVAIGRAFTMHWASGSEEMPARVKCEISFFFSFCSSKDREKRFLINMSLTVFIGCMFSGKSTALVHHASRHRAVGKSVLLINHSFDSRCDDKEVKTHDGTCSLAIKASKLSEVDVRDHDIIGIDEGQFFPDLEEVVKRWILQGKDVAVAGLSGDFMGRPFASMSNILPHADNIVFKKALCMECGEPAIFSKRMIKSHDIVLVGGKSAYRAVCRKHFHGPEGTTVDATTC